ncbi:MAG: TatD family hydrolase [Planctomycetota bacterium]
MIDTHCHLTFPALRDDVDGVVRRAHAAGVTSTIAISTSTTDSPAVVDMAERFANVACSVGVHPCYAAEDVADVKTPTAQLVHHPKVVAVGECGLDYFHDASTADVQAVKFRQQLELAGEVGLPVIVHAREAIAETLAIMADFADVPAVFHCFTGTVAEADAIVQRGYYVGFTGPVTYKKSHTLREACRRVPMDRLLVETDAPYLSPQPVRGKRPCEPAYTMHTAATVAEVHGVSLAEIDTATTANAARLFPRGREIFEEKS